MAHSASAHGKKPQPSGKMTPMMAQYAGIREKAGEDTLLFYRMGDFYELFFEDALKAAAALDIALTKRGKHLGEDIPMCGVPVATAETYLARLIKKGFRVAVCEQTEDPKNARKRGPKSVVERAIVRVVTPGTLTEDSLLEARHAHYLAALIRPGQGDWGLACADVSTGAFTLSSFPGERLESELAALRPKELLISDKQTADPDIQAVLKILELDPTVLPAISFDPRAGREALRQYYGIESLEVFGDFNTVEIAAGGCLLNYLEMTQAGERPALAPLERSQTQTFMSIDPATRSSLELERTLSGGKAGSLLATTDRMLTGPGGRLWRERLARPLMDSEKIQERYDSLGFLKDHRELRSSLREALKASGDVVRALSRLMLGRGGPRDLAMLATGLAQGEVLNACVARDRLLTVPKELEDSLKALSLVANPALASLVQDLQRALMEDLPLLARDGGFIASGWRPELDEIRRLRDDNRRVIASLQTGYAGKSKITSLKIKHNNILGFFVEVTPRHADLLMKPPLSEFFFHRQTMASAVRFTTEELIDLEAKITSASERALALELEVFEDFAQRIHLLAEDIRKAGFALACLDVATGLAVWAEEVDAVRPELVDTPVFDIEGGRHPVVEAVLQKSGGENFTPNSCHLDGQGEKAPRLILLTGPNMAGKSTYLRQNALMAILAQAGCFVPARRARLGLVDRLFSRVGAADDLARGRSTFMAEMIETAAILNQATPQSFVILDEIGRGTATFDGLAIAWAVAEYLYKTNKCRALFATHYHELTILEDQLNGVANACLKAKLWKEELVFLHEVGPGAADKSYGVHVGRRAGLPPPVVRRAGYLLERLENQQGKTGKNLEALPLFSADAAQQSVPVSSEREQEHPGFTSLTERLDQLDPDSLTPREALEQLYALKAFLE